MDKMHSCIGQKMAAGYGFLLIDMAKDSSILATGHHKLGRRGWTVLKAKKIGLIMTDDWRVYQAIVPQNKHVRSKAETFKF